MNIYNTNATLLLLYFLNYFSRNNQFGVSAVAICFSFVTIHETNGCITTNTDDNLGLGLRLLYFQRATNDITAVCDQTPYIYAAPKI